MSGLDLSDWVSKHFPEELIAAAPQIQRPNGKVRRRESDSEFWSRTAHNYIVRCEPSSAGDYGHKQAFRVACALIIGFNLTRSAAMPLLRVWNQACRPPWSSYDLDYKLEQAEKARESHPNPGYLRDNLKRKSKQTKRFS